MMHASPRSCADRIDDAISAVIRTAVWTTEDRDPRLVAELESYVRRPLTR